MPFAAASSRRRFANRFLACSIVALIGSGTYWGIRRATGSAPADARAQGTFRLEPLFVPTLSPCRVETSADAVSFVGFDVPEGHAVRGVLAARVFPALNGAPELGKGVDLTTTQVGGRLDLESWIAKGAAAQPRLLQFCLRVHDGDGEYAWGGWTRLEPANLLHANLVVQPLANQSCTLSVETDAGQVVPGALLGVEPAVLPPGLVPLLLFTNNRGFVRIRGLDADTPYAARLPEGVGPLPRRLETTFRPSGQRVLLKAPIAGRWHMVEAKCGLPLEGGSVQIESVLADDRSLPVAWPVARWIGPGRGPDTPFYLMLPEAHATGTPRPATMRFAAKIPSVDIPDVSSTFAIDFTIDGKKLAARLR